MSAAEGFTTTLGVAAAVALVVIGVFLVLAIFAWIDQRSKRRAAEKAWSQVKKEKEDEAP